MARVKGDIEIAKSATVIGVLPVGANTFVLTADSAAATGIKWAAGGGGGGASWGNLILPSNAPASPVYGDEFDTTGAFGGGYTAATRNGTITWTRAGDKAVADCTAAALDAALFVLIPGTPAAPMKLSSATMYQALGTEIGSGLVFSDGATNSSNWCCLQWVNDFTYRFVTYTGAGAATAGTSVTRYVRGLYPLFIRLEWTSANLFTAYESIDGVNWKSVGTQAFTLTPTHFGLYARGSTAFLAGWEYLRLI